MKSLKFFEKTVFFFNSLAAFILLLSYVLPFLPPKTFSVLSVLGLAVPFLIILNAVFFLYWLIKIKKQVVLSLLVLTIGYLSFGSLYKFFDHKPIESSNAISIMNYNVRLFNLYNWIAIDSVETKLVNFIKNQSPDVLTMQEYHTHKNIDFSFYGYKYEKLSGKKIKYGQAIFSKYKIINSGSVEFPDTANNAIFADIVKGKDTIRVYNIHLQSLRLNTNVENLTPKQSEKLFYGISNTFKQQQFQTELFLLHKRSCKYKMIISGDFNNTAFSYVYKEIKGSLKDAFKEAGNGFGRTYNFKFFPTRIDFILVDNTFTVNDFKTYNVEFSDHYPIMAKIGLN